MSVVKSDKGDEFEFALTAKLRHGALWKLVKQFGSQAALARHLGLAPTMLCSLVNMRCKPPIHSVGWPDVCDKLFVLTGQTPEELFPEWLHGEDFLDLPKNFEEMKRLPATQIKNICIVENNNDRIVDIDRKRKVIKSVIDSLPYREQEVIKLRFGLDDNRTYTIKEIAKIFNKSFQRIRQIEARAIRRMQLLKENFEAALEDENQIVTIPPQILSTQGEKAEKNWKDNDSRTPCTNPKVSLDIVPN